MNRSSKATKFTSILIYVGTFLISLLSFFTTFYGLAIFLDKPLALLGSLGLQTAMLGIAWNLMRLRENRLAYVAVFTVAAMFSIFFSYVNFNSELKGNTRTQEARDSYAAEARPILREYATLAKTGLRQGEYQAQRLEDLLQLENDNGWATVVDEGSNDPFIQSIIDGARRTVASWEKRQGTTYRQGSGRGIIVNYLISWRDQVNRNLKAIKEYTGAIDSLSLLLGNSMAVTEQFKLVNYAAVTFPLIEHRNITNETTILSEPPFTAEFVEVPANRQQAMSLVIDDLYPMDSLTFFSLFFAVIIDLIVIVMALCSSHAVDAVEYVFSRVERDASRRLKKISLDDPQEFTRSLQSNLERLREASEYSRNLDEVLDEFRTKGNTIKLVRGEEKAPADKSVEQDKTPA